jgi:hypothetical protein
MKYLALAALLAASVVSVSAQKPDAAKVAPPATAVVADGNFNDLAKAALAAHGGDKLKQVKTLVMKGSVDLNVSNQIMPGTFSTAISGDKYYFEITSVVQSLKQVFDGQQTYSSIPGFMLPPVNSVGFLVLEHLGDTGYAVQAFAEGKKKGKGFRVVSPDGFFTDFLVDEKTGQVKGFESAYELSNGRVITTSAVIDEVMTVEGVILPKKYSQRFDLGGQISAYATFKTKEILINPQMAENAFAIPR